MPCRSDNGSSAVELIDGTKKDKTNNYKAIGLQVAKILKEKGIYTNSGN